MIDKLENIGFYTLSNNRVINSSPFSPMWRCELIITDQCNFKCLYCRGMRKECRGEMPLEKALEVISLWASDGLKNIRFSGGEPTLHSNLIDMVRFSREKGIERIAVSTNGSADKELYDDLIETGVNDFSISLDSCCSSYSDKMSGVQGYFDKIIDNIKYLSSKTYVTIGTVFTDLTLGTVVDTIKYSFGLGVSDIRIISAAQTNKVYFKFLNSISYLNKEEIEKYPILSYRIKNIENKIPVRGLTEKDSNRCGLICDDSIVAGEWHFPCIIHFREGGKPIGKVGPDMRKERIEYFKNHNTYEDPICRKNCLDVCVEYNNKFKELNKFFKK